MKKETMNEEANASIKNCDHPSIQESRDSSTAQVSDKAVEVCAIPDPGPGHPSDRVRAAFASAIESLKADMGAEGANESEIASSLKSKIREILNEEISKKQQASSVFTAASALTSLCDIADNSNVRGETNKEQGRKQDRVQDNEHHEEVEEERKKVQTNTRDDIPMSFPQKLMEILDDENNEHIITWLPHGKAFIIYQKKKFATEILTKYFKESKYTSFTRKLNRWGFVRVTKGPEIGAYYHKCFQRGNYLLCMQMSCQSSNKNPPRNNERTSQNKVENPLIGSMLSQASAAPFPLNPMALHSQIQGTTIPGGLSRGQFRPTNPQQMDYLSQQIKLMNLQRQVNSAGMLPNAQMSVGGVGGNQFSNAVVAAAVDALQRSYDGSSNNCGDKAALALSHPMQQHIERYQRFGVMHPGLYAAIMQQQAAAAAMLRAQQLRQQQQNQDERARGQGQCRGVAKRAHAA